MSQHRIFTAVELSETAKQTLVKKQNQWSDLPVRWTPKDNLHVTLVFLGSCSDENLAAVNDASKKVAGIISPFSFRLERVILGPPESKPRIFWIKISKADELIRLHDILEKALVEKSSTGYKNQEKRSYLPHVTLGRIEQEEWSKLGDTPRIDEKLNLKIEVSSVVVMESELKQTGAEYQKVAEFEFSGRE